MFLLKKMMEKASKPIGLATNDVNTMKRALMKMRIEAVSRYQHRAKTLENSRLPSNSLARYFLAEIVADVNKRWLLLAPVWLTLIIATAGRRVASLV